MSFDGLIYYLIGSWLFVVVISAGEFLFSLNFERRNRFVLRCVISVAACSALSVPLSIGYYCVAMLSQSEFVTSVIVVMVYLAMFGLSLAGLSFCYRQSPRACVMCGIAGYVSQHIFYNVYGLINITGAIDNTMYIACGREGGILVTTLIQLAVAAAVLTLIYLVFAIRANKYVPDGVLGDKVAAISVATLFIILVLNAVRNVFSGDSVILSGLLGVMFILCCSFILLLRSGLLERNQLKHDIDTLNRLHLEERKHYEQLKENIELVNVKCHDIKHYIEIAEKRDGSNLDELKRLVNIYESDIKTGNETVDTILTERNLYCTAHGIRMTVLADGGKLDFIDVTDLCALFGNAVENAIEAVSAIRDKDKRVISINIRSVAEQIIVCVENYFSGNAMFENGLPVSSKNDSLYHGFGVRSMRMVAEKYDGVFYCAADGDIFRVTVSFPSRD